MRAAKWLVASLAAVVVGACGGGSEGQSGGFRLLQFVESGKDSVPRNRTLVFRFSAPVQADQDLPERLKIQNVQAGGGGSNFSLAVGTYVVDAEKVTFQPQLPEREDRSDAGLRATGEYHVFLKAGPDALAAETGDRIANQQELIFKTSEYFEDLVPDAPPQASRLVAVDPTNGSEVEISRLDIDPADLRLRTSEELLAAGAVIEPGAGGPPSYDTRWALELELSEPIDPQTVNTKTIQMFQIREGALQPGNTAVGGHVGTEVSFPVPVDVEAIQRCDECGVLDIRIRVTPRQTLVDNARYRLVFKGAILGIDYRKAFIGENGLTGDGLVHSAIEQPAPPAEEVGGLGYTAEFLVWDRPAISSSRTLEYNTVLDGIAPEKGQTAVDERLWNSSLYNPLDNQGFAVGFLNAFGDGRDANFAVSGGSTRVLDTGTEQNEFAGNPFPVQDMDPKDEYPNTGSVSRDKAPTMSFDSTLHSEWQFESLTIASASTLQITGVNPARLRVRGIVQIAGVLDASGGDGSQGGNAGAGGPGGYAGGRSRVGVTGYTKLSYGTCMSSFDEWLSSMSSAKALYPFSLHGEGPGRGYAGGDVGNWYYYYDTDFGSTGGGGGGHGEEGQSGEDRLNSSAGVTEGVGKACTQYGAPYSLVLPLRGGGGFSYGDTAMKADWSGGGGGGAGGTVHLMFNYYNGQPAGGGGGGGGGSVEIVCSGPFVAAGGVINVRGGNGGKGAYMPSSLSSSYGDAFSGGGGGGAGGAISIISGDTINLTSALVDARGGAGGLRPNVGTNRTNCKSCNAGGNGGKGLIFLMDADGVIDGIFPSVPGEYPSHQYGVMTISEFDGTRFQSSSAITELFPMPAADPAYEPLEAADVAGVVSAGQRIDLYASSARASANDPLRPDLSTEPGFEGMIPVARIVPAGSGSAVEILPAPPGNGDNMLLLNPTGTPNRDAFVRIRADFHYTNQVEAALGPFAMMDEVTIRFTFNGD